MSGKRLLSASMTLAARCSNSGDASNGKRRFGFSASCNTRSCQLHHASTPCFWSRPAFA
ncbi:hypothetical protein SZ55_1231 [Pseudomonas sp. FeS53a]|nr:hypothetical protein SZ55_1231 [Pseudomonas sp. FeS53a]